MAFPGWITVSACARQLDCFTTLVHQTQEAFGSDQQRHCSGVTMKRHLQSPSGAPVVHSERDDHLYTKPVFLAI